MPSVVSAVLAYLASRLQSRHAMQLEILALRHQLAVSQHRFKRPRLQPADRFLWVWLSRLWPGWQQGLEFVQPRTVLAWQKKRFRDDWRRVSQRGKPSRPTIAQDVRDVIRDMWRSHPTWGSPRIVGELRTLGITVAKSTVETYRPRVRKPPSPTWKAFLKNHVTDLVACDVFTVPTATFTVLFVCIILAHERRRIGHVNITEHPTAQRVIGRIRRDALDHVIVLNERHLRRVVRSYVDSYHTWRTHQSLEMDTPETRSIQPPELGSVRKLPEVGGVHHHYERMAA